MKINIVLILGLLFSIQIFSQVGINTTNVDPSAVLEVKSTNKGLLLPRVALLSNLDKITIPNPAIGLMVFNTNTSLSTVPTNEKIFANIIYTFNGIKWQMVMSDETGLLTANLPRIYSKGRKTTLKTPCNTLPSLPLKFDTRDSNMELDGQIKNVPRTGYYKFYVTIDLHIKSGDYNPVLANGTNSLTYIFTSSTTPASFQDYKVSYSGLVYLNQGASSDGFGWALGGGAICKVATEWQDEQEIIWEYLGDL